jgi:ubiquinone/menaquinone biosynthesis C-methylase UbiE
MSLDKLNVDLSGAAFCDVDETGHAKDFIAYLDLASTCFRPVKRFALSLLQLEPGQFVLDLGCGCGDDLRKLAPLVAPSGLAFGVDNSTSLIHEAQRRHGMSGLPLKFETGDAAHLRWADGFFHACYSDRVLQHLSDPQGTLLEIHRLLKPGGRVVVVDRDWGMVTLTAADNATTTAVLSRASTGIRNGRIGRQLSEMLHNAGFDAVEVYPHRIHIENFATADALLDLQVILNHAVDEHLVEQRAADSWLADLHHRDAVGSFSAAVSLFASCAVKTC